MRRKRSDTSLTGQSADNQQAIGTEPLRTFKAAPAIRRIATSYPELTGRAIARRVGVSPAYVSQVLTRFMSTTAEDLRDFQENKADIYDAMAQRFLESVTSEKLAKTPATSAIVAVGILHDKSALLRGQPTNINVQVIGDVLELIRARRDES